MGMLSIKMAFWTTQKQKRIPSEDQVMIPWDFPWDFSRCFFINPPAIRALGVYPHGRLGKPHEKKKTTESMVFQGFHRPIFHSTLGLKIWQSLYFSGFRRSKDVFKRFMLQTTAGYDDYMMCIRLNMYYSISFLETPKKKHAT